MIEIPAKMSTATHDPLRYFVIGTVFNTVRILALGAVVGFLCRELSSEP